MAVVDVTDSNFAQEVEKSEELVLVDFWAPWCGPCKALAPTLEQLSQNMGNKVKVAKVNIDDNPESPTKYAVRSIPTLVLFKGGSPVSNKVGIQTLDALEKWVESEGTS